MPQGQGEFTYGGNRTGDRYVGQYDKVRLISGTVRHGEIDRENRIEHLFQHNI